MTNWTTYSIRMENSRNKSADKDTMAKQKEKANNYTFIDLFAGAGGLSEGFVQAGFQPLAHVEMNEYAAKTLETRTAYYYFKEKRRLERIDKILEDKGISKVDVVIGGPPCQAYSLVGRAQSSHMDRPMEEDPRNELYKLYARFLKKYQPKMFVFENVMGIASANGGKTWKNVRAQLRRVGYEIDFKEQISHDFGVLQNRHRMIIVGWLKDSELSYPEFKKVKTKAIVNDLLRDLPCIQPGQRGEEYQLGEINEYLRKNGIRTPEDVLTLHVSRPNKERDIEIYRRAIELWNDGHKRLNYNDLPDELKTHKNRNSFLDRFKVVEGDEPCCHTIILRGQEPLNLYK